MASENLKLWQSVEKTDPKYTKAFNRAGGFSGTAINATYLIRKATEQWGPIGGAWGATVEDEKYVPGADGTIIHVIRIKFWHPDGAFNSYGQTTFVGKNKNGAFTDEEAPKKSLTDAITKALAMLGFSADVFLGLYDDNKYVNDRKAEFGALVSAKSVTADVWDSMDEESKQFLQGIADKVRAEIDARGGAAGLAMLEAEHLDADEKVAIWSRFDSKERSAMKPPAQRKAA
jgi:hypothetical protein